MTLQVDKNISIAKSLDSNFYTDQKYFDLTLSKIFNYSWQLISHKSNLGKNNIYPFTFLKDSINEPLVIAQSDDKIECLSNVCTHRGHIINQKKCNLKKMRCPYHGRSFDLDGTMDKMPGFDGAKNFPSKNDNLKKFHILDWGNFIFASINPQIKITDTLKDISNRLKDFNLKNIAYSAEHSKTYNINANWALYCENYLEGLHVPYVHKKLAGEIDIKSYKTKLLDNGVLQYTDNRDNDTYAYYYWIFPNLMLNFYDWGLSINIVEPITANKTRIKFLSYPLSDKNSDWPPRFVLDKLIDEIDRVEMEDEEVVLNVQKGIESKFYTSGRYSPKHEKGTHYFHRLICQYINQ